MKRNVDLNEITDGRLYDPNDMVRAGCADCAGCSDCCHTVGDSIKLDPYDIFRLTAGLKQSFSELLERGHIELNLVDGIILPNLRVPEGAGCTFLDENERCSIHPHRPGFCRMFPLGRYYHDQTFSYIFQINECPMEPKTKIKVEKWLDTPNLQTNQRFINDWHYFLEELSTKLFTKSTIETQKQVQLYLLNLFFVTPYDINLDFYPQFYARLEKIKPLLSV